MRVRKPPAPTASSLCSQTHFVSRAHQSLATSIGFHSTLPCSRSRLIMKAIKGQGLNHNGYGAAQVRLLWPIERKEDK